MTKITADQGRKIYELATSTKPKMSNVEIGKKYGITERAVRFHIAKYEKQVHAISKSNNKVANALASHVVDVISEATSILEAVKNGILEAKAAGVSPEKLAPLYSNWIKSLETLSELLGGINRAPQVNVQINQQFNEFMKVVLEEVDSDTKAKIISRLQQVACN